MILHPQPCEFFVHCRTVLRTGINWRYCKKKSNEARRILKRIQKVAPHSKFHRWDLPGMDIDTTSIISETKKFSPVRKPFETDCLRRRPVIGGMQPNMPIAHENERPPIIGMTCSGIFEQRQLGRTQSFGF